MMTWFQNQAYLMAVIEGGDSPVLAALGVVAKNDLRTYGPVDVPISSELPASVGFHIWEGAIALEDSDDVHSGTSFLWSGNWRPAVLGDFPRFGLPVPLPRLPEGMIHENV
jgi:hypothetical protein